MKTELAKFCRDYEKVLTPFIQNVRETIRVIQKESAGEELRIPLAGLNDVGQRLRTLTDKIKGQQAYLLIFGPLKSGKSTLMNAISQEYVSEVSALPAYPCLVYVRHGDQTTYSVTRYNGRQTDYADTISLQDVIEQCHTALSDRICQKELEGAEFDPQVDYAEAIRRVDIELPIQDLKESSTVLVDTPGLYSRMKFGYDLMTREFRNSAACAIFVVKADNLYLEQVFNEFNELLKLFSRVFLVVNIDSSKQDLAPGGVLRPSLESQDPQRIIQAFETLAMDANLREALESGRLNIYAIDLLRSAVTLLSERHGVMEDEGAAPEPISLDPFKKFTGDLTEYLNSNEYFIAFMRDSLTQGSVFCHEIRGHLSPEALQGFEDRIRVLEKELSELKSKCRSAAELLNADNEGVFQRVQHTNELGANELSGAVLDDVKESLAEDVRQWMSGNESLRDLGISRWTETLNRYAKKLATDAAEQVRSLVDTPMGGADFSDSAVKMLGALDFLPSEIGKAVMSEISTSPESPACKVRLNDEEIPVRKTILDWILFRSRATVRRRLFGEADQLDREIAPENKAKRLTEESINAIQEIANQYVHAEFQGVPRSCARRVMGRYTTEFTKRLIEKLDRIKRDLDREIERRQSDIGAARRVVDALDSLQENISSFSRSIDFLQTEHITEVEIGTAAEPVEGDGAQNDVGTDWRQFWGAVPATTPKFIESAAESAVSSVSDWRLFWQ